MVDQTQNDNDLSSGFLIKDKEGKFKKVNDDKIDDYSSDQQVNEDFIKSSAPMPSTVSTNTPSVKSDINQKPKFEPKPATPVTNQVSFVGEPDEEEEIRSHQDELNKILEETPVLNTTVNPSGIIQEIITKFNLTFDNDILSKRFQKIIESKIKGIRSSIETKEVLHRQTKVGGMNLAEDVADQIVSYVEKNNKVEEPKKVEETGPQVVEEAVAQPSLGQAPPAFIPMPKAPEKPAPVEEKVAEEDNIPIQKKPEEKPVDQPITPTPAPISNADTKPVEELYKKSPSEAMSKIASVRRQEPLRPQVNDIRQPSMVVGPVEELMQIDVKEFRRLGNNPSESAEKVVEKIYLLEEESWQMRMEGIAGWQKSPMHRLYVDIGKESLDKNKNVVEIITDREAVKSPVIHMEEFLALNELNSKLVI